MKAQNRFRKKASQKEIKGKRLGFLTPNMRKKQTLSSECHTHRAIALPAEVHVDGGQEEFISA